MIFSFAVDRSNWFENETANTTPTTDHHFTQKKQSYIPTGKQRPTDKGRKYHQRTHSEPTYRWCSPYSSDDENNLCKLNETNTPGNYIDMQTKDETYIGQTNEMQNDVPHIEDNVKQSNRQTKDLETRSKQLPEPQWSSDESDENNISCKFYNFENEDQPTDDDDQLKSVGGFEKTCAISPCAKESDFKLFEYRPLDKNSFHQASTPLPRDLEHGSSAENGCHAAPESLFGDRGDEEYASDAATDDDLAVFATSETALVRSIHRLIQKVRSEFQEMNVNTLKDIQFILGMR